MCNCSPKKSRSRPLNAIFAITPFDDSNCQNLQMSPINFCASFYRFGDKFLIVDRQEGDQRHRVQFSPFDSKCQFCKSPSFTIFIFAKM